CTTTFSISASLSNGTCTKRLADEISILLSLRVDLSALGDKLARPFLHSFFHSFVFADPPLAGVLSNIFCDLHAAKVRSAHRASSFAKASAGHGIARRKVIGSAIHLPMMTNSLDSHNSNHRVKGFASRGIASMRRGIPRYLT